MTIARFIKKADPYDPCFPTLTIIIKNHPVFYIYHKYTYLNKSRKDILYV